MMLARHYQAPENDPSCSHSVCGLLCNSAVCEDGAQPLYLDEACEAFAASAPVLLRR